MGNLDSFSENAKANRLLKAARKRTKCLRSTEDLVVDEQLIHSYPIPGLKSRLSSAVIFSYLGLKKDVSRIVMVLSRRSRAYMITQGFLAGFLSLNYENLTSMMLTELKMTVKFSCNKEIEQNLNL